MSIRVSQHFTDTHCHLDFAPLIDSLPSLLQQCAQANINRIVVPSVSPSNWQTIINLTKTQDLPVQLHACAGIHPWYLQDLEDSCLEELAQFIEANNKSLIAIGETGIDGKIAIEQDNLRKQRDYFLEHIALANKHNKPLIIHHRRSHNDIIEIIKASPVKHGGIIHAFSGSFQQGKTYIDAGFKLGIGGTITYPRAKKTINAIKRFPLEALVLETDAPAMPISGEQGLANSPIKLRNIFDELVKIRSESTDQIASALEQNVNQVFFPTNVQQ